MATVTKTGSISAHPTSYDTTNYSWASVNTSYPIENAYGDSSNTSYTQINWKTGSGAETYIYLRFDFSSIPENATITSVSASAKAYVNTTNSSRVTTRQMQLARGTTLMGSALTVSNSTSAQTFSSVGTWTRAYLQTAGVRFYVKRGTSNTTSNYYLRIYGATMTVNYSYQETTYSVTITNNTSATVTASDTNPIENTDVEIRSDTISGITIKDNGVDVTSQFTQRQSQPESYSVTNVGSYGFTLNTGTGYYTSNNKGISKSAAVCRVDFYVPVAATITFTYINYAEATYDFGVFGNIDVALSNNYYAAGSNGATITDSSYMRACNTSSYNTSSTQTLAYTMSAGEHSIWVKYSKDDASDANNDTLQFKVAITLNSQFTPGTYYGYDISNISADHTIVVTAAASDAFWFKDSNSTWKVSTVVWKKVNNTWTVQSDLSTVYDNTKSYVKGESLIVTASGTVYTRQTTASVSFDSSALTSGATYHVVGTGTARNFNAGLDDQSLVFDTNIVFPSSGSYVNLPYTYTGGEILSYVRVYATNVTCGYSISSVDGSFTVNLDFYSM